MINWTHALPNYCIAAPVVANPIIAGCLMRIHNIKYFF